MFESPKLKPINPKKPWRRLFLKWAIGITLGVGFLIWPYGHFETKLFPAVSPVTILSAAEHPEGIQIQVEFEKHRSCDFLGVEWYLGNENRSRMLNLIFTEDRGGPPSSRPAGLHRAGPWILKDVNMHEFRHHTYAVARHRCHPFWQTFSRFY